MSSERADCQCYLSFRLFLIISKILWDILYLLLLILVMDVEVV